MFSQWYKHRMQKVYHRFILKVQGNVPSCEHQVDTLASVRDFWGGIKAFQTKKNFTNSHICNFNFFKSSTTSSKLGQVILPLIYLSVKWMITKTREKTPDTNNPTLFLHQYSALLKNAIFYAFYEYSSSLLLLWARKGKHMSLPWLSQLSPPVSTGMFGWVWREVQKCFLLHSVTNKCLTLWYTYCTVHI